LTAYQLCHIKDIPPHTSKSFSIEADRRRIDLFLIRQDKQIYAYKNYCPHTGANLNWQEDQFFDYFNEYVQCAIHGALFAIDTGLCVRGPCVGAYLQAIKIHIDSDVVYASMD